MGSALALALAVLGLLFVAPGAWAYTCGTTLDDFDRGDTPNLGGKWTERAPTMAIAGQRATNPNATAGLATFNNFTATEACVDVAISGTNVQYAGMVLRYGALTQNLFVKVQQNSPGGFNRAYFYVGNNGTGTPTPSSVVLPPFSSGRLHIFVVGNRLTLDIDTNFDGIPEASFGSDYPAGAGTGTDVGLASYGGARLDNFRQPTPASNPTPAPVSPGVPTGSIDDTGKPKLGRLVFSRKRFKAARSGRAVTSARTGTRVRFSLSQSASVRFRVEIKTRGRKVGRRCVKSRRSNRSRRRCTRWVKRSGSWRISGKAGTNRFTFRGRLRGRKLKPGVYRMSARATTRARRSSPVRRKAFRVVRR